MKKNAIFDKCVANVAPEVMEEVSLNVDIANRIYDLLKAKNISQRKFAELMGKRESEISRWLTGRHGFTTNTLAKISAVLGEPIIEVKKDQKTDYVFNHDWTAKRMSVRSKEKYIDRKNNNCTMSYCSTIS